MFNLDTFSREIAAYLPGWTVPKPSSDDTVYWRSIEGPGGARLALHYNERLKKIEVIPCYIVKNGIQYPTNYRDPSSRYHIDPPFVGRINIGISRTPESAAKDIKKRVIDGYLPLFEKGKVQLAELEAYQKSRASIASEFAKLLNDDDHNDESETVTRFVYKPGNKGTCYVQIRVNSEDVELKLSSCPVDVAKQILALFPKLDPGQRTA